MECWKMSGCKDCGRKNTCKLDRLALTDYGKMYSGLEESQREFILDKIYY